MAFSFWRGVGEGSVRRSLPRLLLASGSTRGGMHSFPTLFVAVVVVEEGGDFALLVVLHGEAGPNAAQGIEKRIGRFGLDFSDFAVGILLVEGFALAEEGGSKVAVGVAVFAGNSVKDGHGKLNGGGMEGHYQALGIGGRLGIGA